MGEQVENFTHVPGHGARGSEDVMGQQCSAKSSTIIRMRSRTGLRTWNADTSNTYAMIPRGSTGPGWFRRRGVAAVWERHWTVSSVIRMRQVDTMPRLS